MFLREPLNKSRRARVDELVPEKPNTAIDRT
jgi:hypothetical protein